MKFLLATLALMALSLGTLGNTAKAQTQTCLITNTGPGSINTCESFSDYSCRFDNKNDFTVISNNPQESLTGIADINDNTIGGNATTGTAKNNSGTVIRVSINNDIKGCQIASVTSVTPTPTPSPTPSATLTPTPTPVVKVLANTGTNNTLTTLLTLVAGLGAVALLSTLGVLAYRSKN